MANGTWVKSAAYDRFMGRWSGEVAGPFLAWLGVAPGLRWLDVGCGTGALTAIIAARAAPEHVVGIDLSAEFVAVAATVAETGRGAFCVADGRALPFPDGAFDVVVSGLAVNFIPDPPAGLAEMRRVARPGAPVAFYVWDFTGKMEMLQMFWSCARALDGDAPGQDEGELYAVCVPERLGPMMRKAGFDAVEATALDITMGFRDFDDLWQPFLGAAGTAPGYIAGLSEAGRLALRERFCRSLPVDGQGRIGLAARAWAVRGLAPAGSIT